MVLRYEMYFGKVKEMATNNGVFVVNHNNLAERKQEENNYDVVWCGFVNSKRRS